MKMARPWLPGGRRSQRATRRRRASRTSVLSSSGPRHCVFGHVDWFGDGGDDTSLFAPAKALSDGSTGGLFRRRHDTPIPAMAAKGVLGML